LLNLDSEKSGDYVSHTKKVALNLRVVDNNGIAITPIISEMVVCKHYYEHTSYYNDLEAGYLIYNNEIFFRSEDKFDNKSSENIGLNKILTENNAACSLEELKKFLQPCEPITDEDKVVMLHKYVSHIMDFQQHYEVSEINKDKMNWDGETLTIHTL
jgi:hypothetical protein